MTALIVTAHPDPDSLTHHVARRLVAALGPDRAEVAHLAQEGFDPVFGMADRGAYAGDSPAPADVLAEQARLDAVDHVVLVFPVWWWSMPALLKGWIDRTFIAGWAFGIDDEGRIEKRLQRLTVHLVPVSGTSRASFARHGYLTAFETQVGHGILDYCGVRRGATAFVHDSESGDREAVAAEADRAVTEVVAAIAIATGSEPVDPRP
ncbi:NAD(P)H-dependent oxidoreductase [Clavibacter michiganensis]|uniref:NAD(P)H-dependent oxidoreductase n=1 Tax=Clavibacter michiganensis TaxID=28447 RepID=UPI0009A82BA1|nr:NAD(P)H-dependent oxidoreductase [Clavibacter michiganensis]MBF4638992.1 NAD(P)H-dependent oxidoreductase [Clavibacter michiganensis subsp. michiganensis]MDO4124780.1 NAD(P)H-dependent oxidoreductase [Clavibacter michiganensis]MDO4139548.1 NAD(P)H-dependent oxidoreductase [Clavibacter michiganensis]MWJ07548.1 flavodoxin family protein [Clavibacter michiganensis subsp. michiganensis]MWJ88744.1 flavodoxin family protein [Clavibacter michiganensis subsp. michiganensis]